MGKTSYIYWMPLIRRNTKEEIIALITLKKVILSLNFIPMSHKYRKNAIYIKTVEEFNAWTRIYSTTMRTGR